MVAISLDRSSSNRVFGFEKFSRVDRKPWLHLQRKDLPVFPKGKETLFWWALLPLRIDRQKLVGRWRTFPKTSLHDLEGRLAWMMPTFPKVSIWWKVWVLDQFVYQLWDWLWDCGHSDPMVGWLWDWWWNWTCLLMVMVSWLWKCPWMNLPVILQGHSDPMVGLQLYTIHLRIHCPKQWFWWDSSDPMVGPLFGMTEQALYPWSFQWNLKAITLSTFATDVVDNPSLFWRWLEWATSFQRVSSSIYG